MISEILKKEYWLPYAEVVFIALWWFNTEAVESWLTGYGIPYATYVVGAVGIVMLGILLVVPARHDKTLESRVLDERETYHELAVSNLAYHVAVFGLGAYLLFWQSDPILLGFLALILLSRLWKRYELEKN